MLSSQPAILVEGLGKRYRRGAGASYGRLTESLASLPRRLTGGRAGNLGTEFWALRNLSFQVDAGEIVGVVGANGAGKSTLLKLLSRITRPTEGRAQLRGRVGALLEVGTGFHPELTGRENVFLSGGILGLAKKEIEAKFDEIVDFAGVGSFLDTPVKRYSSGMQVRLGFAVAAHLDTDILLIDEVLAVGDVAFQRKSLARMQAVSSQGRTVLFVSHNTPAVSRLCDTSLLLVDGALALYADTQSVIDTYLQSQTGEATWSPVTKPEAAEVFRFTHAAALEVQGRPTGAVSAREPVILEIAYDVLENLEGLVVGVIATNERGIIVFDSYDIDSSEPIPELRKKGSYVARCVIPSGLLNSGKLALSLNAFIQNARRISYVTNALSLDVWEPAVAGQELSMLRRGVVAPKFEWSIEGDQR